MDTIFFPIGSPLVYNPEELINEYITLNTTNRNGKNTDKRVIKEEKLGKDKYHIDLENINQRVLEYNKIVEILTKYNKEGIERWTYESAKYQKNNPYIGSGKIAVIIKLEKYE